LRLVRFVPQRNQLRKMVFQLNLASLRRRSGEAHTTTKSQLRRKWASWKGNFGQSNLTKVSFDRRSGVSNLCHVNPQQDDVSS
jgi:hypothetical protein